MTHHIEVSVVMTVFNHAPYLERALESVLAQVTDFQVEVVIGDDASSDASSQILTAFAARHPDAVRPIIRPHNIGATRNLADLIRRCRGRFITFLEGDDYWTETSKLQVQRNFLAAHPQFRAVSHQLAVRDEFDRFMHITPETRQTLAPFTLKNYLKGDRFPLTATMFHLQRSTEFEAVLALIEDTSRNVADTTLCIHLLKETDLAILPRCMAVYQCRSVPGHSNYNSITTTPEKLADRFRILLANDRFYRGKLQLGTLYRKLLLTALKALWHSPENARALLPLIGRTLSRLIIATVLRPLLRLGFRLPASVA